MPSFTLEKYIWYREGVRIQWPDDTTDKAISEEPQLQEPSYVSRLSLPVTLIPSLYDLERIFQDAPRVQLRPTLDKLVTELWELEQLYKVALLNPSVTDASRHAREYWRRAEKLWRVNLIEKGDRRAHEAVRLKIVSLIAAYQTTAAHKIVEARQYIEIREWKTYPTMLMDMHRKARNLYQKGRGSQDGYNNDVARSYFMESIIDIEKLYLESERLQHTIRRDSE